MGAPNDALVGDRRVHLMIIGLIPVAFAEDIRQRAPDLRGALLEPSLDDFE